MRSQGKRLFAILGGAFFITYVFLNLMLWVINSIDYGYMTGMKAPRIFFLLACTAFGVLLLIGKRNIGFIIAAGVIAIVNLIWLIQDLEYVFEYEEYLTQIIDLFYLLSAITLLALTIMACIPALSPTVRIIKYLWYIPAALMFVAIVATMIQYINVRSLLQYVHELGAYLMTGLWFASFSD